MIYFYHGTDTDKARMKASELIDSLRKKKPDAGFFKIDSENFNTSKLDEYIGGQGLFSNKYIVFVDRICSDKNVKDDFLDKLKEISESENIFIILEGKIDKATLTRIEKKSAKTAKFDLPDKVEKPIYNAFALSGAFGRKDKKEAWMMYRKAIDAGEAPEALHGMIFWKVKSMILSLNSAGSYIWKNEELMDIIEKLVDVYHEARRGKNDLETGLEGVILGIK